MEPSENLAKIQAAISALVDWNKDPATWPVAAMRDVHGAIVELVRDRAAMGIAETRLRPEAVGVGSMAALLRLHKLAGEARADPQTLERLVADLGAVALELVAAPADLGIDTSRKQQEKAGNPRYKDEKKAQFETAGQIYREWGSDGKHHWQRQKAATVAREVGKRLYDDKEIPWPCKPKTIAKRLRKYPKRWKQGGQPADAEPG